MRALLLTCFLLLITTCSQAQYRMAVIHIDGAGTYRHIKTDVSLTVTNIMDETQPVVKLTCNSAGIFEYTDTLPAWLSVSIKDSLGAVYTRKIFAEKGQGTDFYIGKSAYHEFEWGKMKPYTPVKNLYYIEAEPIAGGTLAHYKKLARYIDSLTVKKSGDYLPAYSIKGANAAIRQRALADLLRNPNIIIRPLYHAPGNKGVVWFDKGATVIIDASLSDAAAAAIFKKHGIKKFKKLEKKPDEYAAYTSCVVYYIEFTPAQIIDYGCLKTLTRLYASEAVLYIKTGVINYARPD